MPAKKSVTTDQALAVINKQIYEQNVELAIRNRTLSLLSTIYEIINTSLGIQETAQKLVEDIVKELSFQNGFILLVDKKTKTLNHLALALSPSIKGAKKESLEKIFKKFNLSLKEQSNYCVEAVNAGQKRMSNFLYDVFVPAVDEPTALELQEKCNIQTTLLYPITFGGEVIGVLGIGMSKHIGFLSRGEREALRELVDVVSIAIERAQIYVALKNANKRLRQLDKLKDDFLSMASHELRTPMTAIKSYLWMALNRPPQKIEPELKKYLEISYNSTERLINLVNEMLTVSRIERNKIELHLEVINFRDVALQVYEELKIKADEKQIQFTLKPEQGDFMIEGDKEKLREVIQNIVGNALKFTPEKGIISITFNKGDHHVSLAIADTGPGIPQEDMGKLFSKFGKIEHSYKNIKQPGTGLGLYISKEVITLHKGKIQVESEVNKGTTFTIILPIVIEGRR